MTTPTRINPIVPPGPYVTEGAAAQLAVVTPVTADTVNGNVVKISRGVMLRAHNSGGSTRTITITSQPDPTGRVANITGFSIAAGAIVIRRFARTGWANANGDLQVTASHADVKFEIYRL
jgi:hypothetical protein